MNIHTKRRPSVVSLLLLLLVLAVVPAMASPISIGPTIISDKIDYAPGETVTLTGQGWANGESVHIFVNDDIGQTWSHNSVPDPFADSAGAFTYSFQLPSWFVANYIVVATGSESGVATTSFTDMAVGTYDQCANDETSVPPGSGYPPTDPDPGCHWIQGNLQSNTAYYAEGDATVQRVWLTDFAPGSEHSVTLQYGTTKGGNHAYDFLTTWDWSEDWITLDDRCQSITGCNTAAETRLDIPEDPSVPNNIEPTAPGAREFVMRGGTLISATNPALGSGTYAGDSETVITVTFSVPTSGPMCETDKSGTTCGVVLWFGAHVSVSGQWMLYNGTTGAGTINGSPYHVSLYRVDGASAGNRDNQMQSQVVTQVPNGTIVIVKDAVPNDPQDFQFNLTNNDTINLDFVLDDDADLTEPNSETFSVPPGTWYASEIDPLPAGWSLTNLVCFDPTSNTTVSGNEATIDLASNETVTCTFTDTKAGHIIVEKQTIPDGSSQSFSFDPSWSEVNFDLTDGQQNDSGPLTPGSYSVAELTPPAGWSSDGGVCTSSIGDTESAASIELDAGETVTCVFTNTFGASDLTATKTAVASYIKEYTWDIAKTVDKTLVNVAGDGSADFNYTVTVSHDNGTDKAWAISGAIEVSNPNPYEVTGVNVSDAIDPNATCTVTGGSDTIAANATATFAYTCTYSAAPAATEQTNTATVTWTEFGSGNTSTTATADVDWGTVAPQLVDETAKISDTHAPTPPLPTTLTVGTAENPTEFNYSKTFLGVAGTCKDFDNTATVTATDSQTTDSANQTVTICAGADLTVTKTVAGSYDREYKWLIDKSVDDTRIEIAAGGKATFNYDVKVTPNGSDDSNIVLGGEITVANPNVWQAVTVSVSDALDQGGTCTITELAPYVVPANDSLTLHYTCDTAGSVAATLNTATIEWDSAAAFTPSGSALDDAPVDFTVNETNKTITVIDDKTNPLNPVELGTWDWADGAHTFEYALEKAGVGGECTEYTNTAKIDKTGQSDSETVTVCVGEDLTVDKTATGTFDRAYSWRIDKTVDDDEVAIAEGGNHTFNYDVLVEQTGVADSNWQVSGTISVMNPNKWQAITLTGLTDTVSGATCVLNAAGPYEVPADGTLEVGYTCTYAAQPENYSDANNVEVTWDNAGAFTPSGSATDSANFTLAQVGADKKTVTVEDSFGGALGEVTAKDEAPFASQLFEYPRTESGEAGTCTTYDNTASIVETGQSDDQTVQLCVGSNLTVTKTAVGAYNREYFWDIDKRVDDTRIEIAAGDTATFNYTVDVMANGILDSGWTLGGTITVVNPNDWQDVTVTVGDTYAGGGVCTVTGGENVVVPKGESIVLNYTCTFDAAPGYNGLNTATATWDAAAYFTPGDNASGTSWVQLELAGETNRTVTVEDDQTTDTPVQLGTSDYYVGPFVYTYSLDKQGVGGTCTTYDNTATITETEDTDSQAVEVCVGQDVTVTKTATPSFARDWTWTITKDFDGSYDLFAGESVTHNYKVSVDPKFSDRAWKVIGTIKIENPNDWEPIEVNVADAVNLGGDCEVESAVVTVEPSNFDEISYTCTWAAQPESYEGGLNTATATWDAEKYFTPNGEASGTELFKFENPAETNPVITVDDDNLSDEVWTANRAYAEWTYTKDFSCSTEASAYTNGKYSYSLLNTATINETGQSNTATVDVDCYAPVVTKEVETYWDRDWDWSITKDSDGTYDLFAGDTVTHNYKVTVTPTSTDNGWGVKGTITVKNFHPTDPMTLTSLSDLAGGINATVTCPGMTVPAAGSLTCDYDTTAQDSEDDNPFGPTNTATAVFAGVNWVGTAPIVFSTTPTTEQDPVITVDDDNLSDEAWTANRAYAEWTYTKDFSCSTEASAYTNGKYSYSLLNTATINETEQFDTAKVDVTCDAPTLTIVKEIVGSNAPSWSFTGNLDPFTSFTLPSDGGSKGPHVVLGDTAYIITEGAYSDNDPSREWVLTDITCVGNDDDTDGGFTFTPSLSGRKVDVTLIDGEDVTCTFTNTEIAISIVKTTAAYGNEGDAIVVLPGDPVTWNYLVTNEGAGTLENVSVTDNKGVTVTCLQTTLTAGQSMTCTASGVATGTPGELGTWYENIGTASGSLNGATVTDSDPSSYFVPNPGTVTNSSLCNFGDQFRLIFTPDMARYSSSTPYYKLSDSNPGQFFYNVFYVSDGAETVTMEIPYPFVTQGAMPVHVYGDLTVAETDGQNCFQPTDELATYGQVFSLANYTDTNGDGTVGYGDVYIVEIPAEDGFGYYNIHLDYGLEKTDGWLKKGSNATSDGTGKNPAPEGLSIVDDTAHTFTAAVDGSLLAGSTDAIYNLNEFKQIRGFGGLVLLSDDDPVKAARVELIGPDGVVIATMTTDSDGWYLSSYVHKGKTTTYTLKLLADPVVGYAEQSVEVTVGGNVKFGEGSFTIPLPLSPSALSEPNG